MLRYKVERKDLATEWLARPESAGETTVREFRVRTTYPGFAGEAQVLALDGMALVRGRHRAQRPLVLDAYEEAPEVALHIGLRGGPTAIADGLDGYLSHAPHEIELVFTPSPKTSFALDPGADNEAFEVNFTLPRFAAWASQHPGLLGPFVERIQRGEPFRARVPLVWGLPRVLQSIDEIMDSQRFDSLRALYLETKVMELLLQLRAGADSAPPRPRGTMDRMVAARDHLLQNLRRPPTLEAMARSLGTNTFQLKRDFRGAFQTSVYAFVLDARLELARQLILDTTKPLKAIAEEVGYRHAAHFSAAFSKRFGVPPSRLRGRRT